MKYILALVAGLIASFVQLGLLDWVTPDWAIIFFPLAVLLWFVINAETSVVLVTAASAGIVLDGLSSLGVGVNTLSLVSSALVMIFITNGILPKVDHPYVVFGMLAIGTLAYLLTIFILQSVLSVIPHIKMINLGNMLGWETITRVLSTTVVYLLIVKPLGNVFLSTGSK